MGRYYPTEEQVKVRSRARRLYDDGYRLIGEWCMKIPELTMRKWKRWESDGGFLGWWTDLFPEHASVTIADLRVVQEARWLIGLCINVASTQPKHQMTAWGSEKNFNRNCAVWGAARRWRIASQVDSIRHWRVENCSYSEIPDLEATWFVDPPYQDKGKWYVHGSSGIDYPHLGGWCAERKGEAIVCEQSGADWLPFRFAGEVFSSQYSESGERSKSSEVVWTTSRPRQIRLPW